MQGCLLVDSHKSGPVRSPAGSLTMGSTYVSSDLVQVATSLCWMLFCFLIMTHVSVIQAGSNCILLTVMRAEPLLQLRPQADLPGYVEEQAANMEMEDASSRDRPMAVVLVP